MAKFVRDTGLTIVIGLCLMTVTGADDAATAAAEAEAAVPDAATPANPQAADEAERDGSLAGDAPAVKGDGAADAEGAPEASEPAEEKPAEEEPADGDEPSAEDQAFLADPFTSLQGDMQSATVDLKDGQTKQPASVTQPRILRHLNLLIEQLEQQGSGAGQAGQRVNQPAQQSSLMRGPGGQNEMRAPRDDGRDWAELTPQERQKILQSKTDGFPAGYDDILADYFRRVARAQAAEASAPAGAPGADDEPAAAAPPSSTEPPE